MKCAGVFVLYFYHEVCFKSMDFFKGISEVFRGKNGFLSYENKDLR